MVDMGQAESSLYERKRDYKMCWTRALLLSAKEMGHTHYMDVPTLQDEELRRRARLIYLGDDHD